MPEGPADGENHPAVSSGDFGWCSCKPKRDLPDSETFFILKNHFVPSKSYQLPLGGR